MWATRKGQFDVVEQVILFGLGVAIVSGFLAAFQGFSHDVKQDAVEQQSKLLADVLASHIIQLAATDARGSVYASLPDSIAGEPYRINLTEAGVVVIVNDQSHTSFIYGLTERYQLSGSVTNSYETAIISIDEQHITIGGP